MKNLRWRWLLGLLVCGAGAWCQGILIPASFYAVQGAPFTLTVETRWERASEMGPKQGTQRIMRDSAGRQRYEGPVIDGAPQSSTVGIYDVVAGEYIKLDMDARTAEVRPMRVGRTVVIDVSAATSVAPFSAAADQTLLGTREIAGLEAWGQRTLRTTTRGDGSRMSQDRELWLSTHYRMPVMQVIRSDQGKTTQTVVSFSPAEPEPTLFKIPSGFAVHDAPPAPEPTPGTVRIGGNVSAPVVLKQAAPEFSEEARRAKVNGNVLIHLIVDEQGLPQDVKVIRGIGLGLDEKALKAVQQYRFKPAMREGLPVKVEMNVELNFQIR
jgi:TonB family protein